MNGRLGQTTPLPTPPPGSVPCCYDCQWLDYMYDTTGDRTYETRLLEHVNARHVRAAR